MGESVWRKYSIFFVIGPQIPSQQMRMMDIYDKYHDKDGFLYIVYLQQESF
jgi:hypothetical protein